VAKILSRDFYLLPKLIVNVKKDPNYDFVKKVDEAIFLTLSFTDNEHNSAFFFQYKDEKNNVKTMWRFLKKILKFNLFS